MSPRRVIPATPLFRRYRALKSFPEEERLRQARHFAEHPLELGRELSESVGHFTSYDNRGEGFFEERQGHTLRDGPIVSTIDLAHRLQAAGRVAPREPEGGRLEVELPMSVASVPAEELAFDYVDREVTVTRTRGAEWEGGIAAGRSRFSLDLLLAAVDGRVPIAAEVKIGGDKDAWYAFVQALAGLAYLATPNQYERLRAHLNDRGRWPDLAGRPPRLDLYVLFVDSPQRGRYRDALTDATARAIVGLLNQAESAPPVRRVVGLDLHRGEDFEALVRFAWQRVSRDA